MVWSRIPRKVMMDPTMPGAASRMSGIDTVPNTSTDRFRRSLIFHYVPKSTIEMSHYYEALSFDGAKHEIAVNMEGGPCGATQDVLTGQH